MGILYLMLAVQSCCPIEFDFEGVFNSKIINNINYIIYNIYFMFICIFRHQYQLQTHSSHTFFSTFNAFNYSPCLSFSLTLSPSGSTYLLPAVALTFSISLICLLSSVHCSLFTVHCPQSSTLPGTRQFAFYDICFARVSLAFCSRVLGQKTFYSDCQLQLHCLLFPASLSSPTPLVLHSSSRSQVPIGNFTLQIEQQKNFHFN